MDGWKNIFLLGWYIFRVYVKLPTGKYISVQPQQSKLAGSWPNGPWKSFQKYVPKSFFFETKFFVPLGFMCQQLGFSMKMLGKSKKNTIPNGGAKW